MYVASPPTAKAVPSRAREQAANSVTNSISLPEVAL